MKRLVFMLMVLTSLGTVAQIDNFSDGDFTANPTWSGDAASFIVNTSQQLQLNSSGTGVSYLSSALNLTTLDSSEWRCYVSQPFAGSASNNGKIYLTSDQADLEAPLNGYFVQLGEALSNDAVELFKQAGTTVTSIARCTNGAIASGLSIGIRVTRSNNAEWKVYVDYSGGTNYVFQAGGTDAAFNTSAFFGVVCSYTSSNATNFFFDNFSFGSIIIDVTAPAIFSATATAANTVDVKFSELVSAATAQDINNYLLNGNSNPVSAIVDAGDNSLVHLTFANNFTQGIISALTINNIADASNNIINANSTVDFVLPATPAKNDILINEILFNPKPDEYDFVEIYNNADKIFDLQQLHIANTDSKDSLATTLPLSASSRYFYPGTYLLLTENMASILYQFPLADTSNYMETDIPSFNDDEGTVVIVHALNRIDQFNYKDDYHYPILNDKEGASLERISFSIATQNKTNWHTAAQTVHYGTPGYRNSQSITGEQGNDELTVTPEVFSPDNDGYNDVLTLNYNFSETGYAATVRIYDGDGRLVKDVANNELISPTGTFIWDGISNTNEKARIGIYVVMMEAVNSNGDKKKFKKSCVLAGKL